MLQESSSSEGPRVPGSIHSTQDSIKTPDPTLMRLDLHHGSQEFSDLSVRHGWSRVSSDECAGLGHFGLISPRQVGYIMF